MTEKRTLIDIGGGQSVSAIRTDARGARWTFLYAPGAGSSIDDPFGKYASDALAAHGISTVRFQFPYQEAGRKSPDRPPILEATWQAAIADLRGKNTQLVVGGRSMGGRIASMVVAGGDRVDALALFAYPLHPPGKPDQARVAHLSAIKTPTLFVSGTRDAFGSPAELGAASKKVRGAKLHLLEGADHGFAVPKSSGRTKQDVFAEAASVLSDWLQGMA